MPDWVLEPIYAAVARAPLEELSLDLDETRLLLCTSPLCRVHAATCINPFVLGCAEASHKHSCLDCTSH